MVLVVSLIFLLMLTILGVSTMSSSSMEEKMAGHAVSREIAFQMAEAALRDGERYIDAQTDLYTFAMDTCDMTGREGVCTPREHDVSYDGQVPKDCSVSQHIPNRWETCPSSTPAATNNLDVWTTSNRHRTYSGAKPPNVARSVYIIEFMGHVIEEGKNSLCDLDNNGGHSGDPKFNDTPSSSASWPYCPDDLSLYRVTALGYGTTTDTRVMLQSTYLAKP